MFCLHNQRIQTQVLIVLVNKIFSVFSTETWWKLDHCIVNLKYFPFIPLQGKKKKKSNFLIFKIEKNALSCISSFPPVIFKIILLGIWEGEVYFFFFNSFFFFFFILSEHTTNQFFSCFFFFLKKTRHNFCSPLSFTFTPSHTLSNHSDYIIKHIWTLFLFYYSTHPIESRSDYFCNKQNY